MTTTAMVTRLLTGRGDAPRAVRVTATLLLIIQTLILAVAAWGFAFHSIHGFDPILEPRLLSHDSLQYLFTIIVTMLVFTWIPIRIRLSPRHRDTAIDATPQPAPVARNTFTLWPTPLAYLVAAAILGITQYLTVVSAFWLLTGLVMTSNGLRRRSWYAWLRVALVWTTGTVSALASYWLVRNALPGDAPSGSVFVIQCALVLVAFVLTEAMWLLATQAYRSLAGLPRLTTAEVVDPMRWLPMLAVAALLYGIAVIAQRPTTASLMLIAAWLLLRLGADALRRRDTARLLTRFRHVTDRYAKAVEAGAVEPSTAFQSLMTVSTRVAAALTDATWVLTLVKAGPLSGHDSEALLLDVGRARSTIAFEWEFDAAQDEVPEDVIRSLVTSNRAAGIVIFNQPVAAFIGFDWSFIPIRWRHQAQEDLFSEIVTSAISTLRLAHERADRYRHAYQVAVDPTVDTLDLALLRPAADEAADRCEGSRTTWALAVVEPDNLNDLLTDNDDLTVDGTRVIRSYVRALAADDALSPFGMQVFHDGAGTLWVLITAVPTDDTQPATETTLRAALSDVRLPHLGADDISWVHFRAGLAVAGADGSTYEDLVQIAQTRLGMADDHTAFDSTYHLNLADDLPDALTRGDAELVVQPIVTTADARTCGGELTLDWIHPEYGRVTMRDISLNHGLGVAVAAALVRAAVDFLHEVGVDESNGFPLMVVPVPAWLLSGDPADLRTVVAPARSVEPGHVLLRPASQRRVRLPDDTLDTLTQHGVALAVPAATLTYTQPEWDVISLALVRSTDVRDSTADGGSGLAHALRALSNSDVSHVWLVDADTAEDLRDAADNGVDVASGPVRPAQDPHAFLAGLHARRRDRARRR